MMERLNTDDDAQLADEPAPTTKRTARSCGAISTRSGPIPSTKVLALVRWPQFVETERSRPKLADLAALRRTPETRESKVAPAVPGVRDVAYRTRPGEELRPRFH